MVVPCLNHPAMKRTVCLVFLAAFYAAALAPVSSAAEAKEFPGLGDPGKPVGLIVHAAAGELDPASQPAAKLVGPDARLQFTATAKFDSGQFRDWTREASYSASPKGVVQVSEHGLVVPVADGKATITVDKGGLKSQVEVEVVQYSDPPLVNFPNQVVPIFTKLDCNSGGCHGKSGGQNGFALSLLGFEPREDYVHLVKEGRGRRLFPSAPERSLLLRKAIGGLPHGGGMRMNRDSDDYRLLRRWIQQGMPYGSEDDPVLQSIRVFPAKRTMPLEGKQQLRVIAYYSDGTTEDVTTRARYSPNNTEMAKVDESGVVEMLGSPGGTAVMIRYQGQATAFQATIPLGVPVEKLPPERNFVDKLVFDRLQELGLPPSPVSDDSTFLRRVTLDIAGRLPALEETQAFLADTDPDKRDKLIDRLLASNAYADYFAQKWGAILRNKAERNASRSGNFLFHAWLRDSLMRNVPYDEIVRQLITASGDVRTTPAVNWYQHLTEPDKQIEDIAQVFLGVRIQCARCHHHPFEKWSQNDYWGLAAFFSNVKRKPGTLPGQDRVYSMRGRAVSRHPKTNEQIVPTALGADALELSADDDPRLALMDWMAAEENRFFARTLANRYWKHFFGRGIVDPEDDMRATNPPANPELLDALAEHFIQSGFDLKDLIRTICRSSTYQLTAHPNEVNEGDTQSFSRFYARRLPAEVLLDSIDRVMGTDTRFRGLPSGTRAVELPDHGEVDNPFLNTFGRPAGASACECERSGDVSMAQSLLLLNSNDLYGKLSASRAAQLAADNERSDEEKVTELYLRAFSRRPNAQELAVFGGHLASVEPNERRAAFEDILWTLINTKEFMFNH